MSLVKYEWQYEVRHQQTNAFAVGQKVFVTCNPKTVLLVKEVTKENITICWRNSDGEYKEMDLPPQCILQYRFAGLLIYKGAYKVCLN